MRNLTCAALFIVFLSGCSKVDHEKKIRDMYESSGLMTRADGKSVIEIESVTYQIKPCRVKDHAGVELFAEGEALVEFVETRLGKVTKSTDHLYLDKDGRWHFNTSKTHFEGVK